MTIAIAQGTGTMHISTVRDLAKDFFVEMGNVCYDVSVVLPIVQETVEMTDKELLLLMSQSKAFDFWNDEAEDIYSLSDGEPL